MKNSKGFQAYLAVKELRSEVYRRLAQTNIRLNRRAIDDKADSIAAAEALAEAKEKGKISLEELKRNLLM